MTKVVVVVVIESVMVMRYHYHKFALSPPVRRGRRTDTDLSLFPPVLQLLQMATYEIGDLN
jgi:hypothetical protein